jgi:hypothetical protein
MSSIAPKHLLWFGILGGVAVAGCSSLQSAYERAARQSEPMLDLSTCEGRFDSDSGKNVVYRYEITEGVEYRGATATKVEVENVIGGVGYEMSIYDIYDRWRVDALASLLNQEGKGALESETAGLRPDIVEINSHVGRFSLPGGTYDVSGTRDLSEFTGIQEGERQLRTDAVRLYERAMLDAAFRKEKMSCD